MWNIYIVKYIYYKNIYIFLCIWRLSFTLCRCLIKSPYQVITNKYKFDQAELNSINVTNHNEPCETFSSLFSPPDLHLLHNHPRPTFPSPAAHQPSHGALLLMNFLSRGLKNVNTQSHSNWILKLSKFLPFFLQLEHSLVCSLGTLSHSLLQVFVMYPTSVRGRRAASEGKPPKSCRTSRARFFARAILELSYSGDNSQRDWPVQKGLREGRKEPRFFRFTHDMLEKCNTFRMTASSGNVANETCRSKE